MKLDDLFAIARRTAPDKPALEFAADGQSSTLTYRQLYQAADRLAAGLQAWGLAKGDRVAFFLGNRPEFVIAYLAIIRLGAVAVPVNLRYRRLELVHIFGDCAPRLLITERAQLAVLAEAGVDAAFGQAVLVAEELEQWQANAQGWTPPWVDGDDLAFIMYTSGTTGRSKGAMISHNNVLATMTGLLAAWAWQASDRLLLCLPLFHIHGLVVGLHCALAAGATVLLRTGYRAGETLGDLLRRDSTVFFAVPTLYVRLVDELRQMPAQEWGQMRLFCSGSAPLAPDTFDAFQALTGHTILERYGMTETGMNLSNPYAGPRLAGTVGTALPGVQMRIVDAQGQDLAPGQEGEILLAGSNVFSGYWNAPDKTAASFSQDDAGRQWFHTGDLARQDPLTGYVSLLGRRHELIISGGFNIYPREIEELLLTFAGVQDAAVVGVPHAEWGEVPVAYLVCTGEVADQALVVFCKGQLAGFKVPRQFHRVAALPRNAMGKLQKHLLGEKA